jgi:DNA-directed RNA polymerase specialized sigma24 family protein
METLTQKVLRYQKTGQGLHEIVDDIGPRVYQFPRRTMGWDEDACGDFYVFIHPRIIRLLHRFRDQGRPFESYLWTVLNWQLRNFARDRHRAERRWQVSLRVDPGALAANGESLPGDTMEADAPTPSPLAASRLQSAADRRNFLFLVLKCSRRLDPARAPAFAGLAGITPQRLLSLVAELRDLRAGREARQEMFRGRRNACFALTRLLETEIAAENDPEKLSRLRERLRRARRRMRTAMLHMSRVALAPTNREIGQALGVPKGTVDSGLFWLKRKLAAVYDPRNLRPAS